MSIPLAQMGQQMAKTVLGLVLLTSRSELSEPSLPALATWLGSGREGLQAELVLTFPSYLSLLRQPGTIFVGRIPVHGVQMVMRIPPEVLARILNDEAGSL